MWYFLLSQHGSPVQQPSSAQGIGKHRNLLRLHSLSSLCACSYTQHNCSISSGFSLCYPFITPSKQDSGYHCPGDTLCWQRAFFMQAAQKLETQSTVQQEQTNHSAMKTTTVKAFRKEDSRFYFQMCRSTNACSFVCHLRFTNYSHFSHTTMLQESSVIQMKCFQHYHPKHENRTIYFIDSPNQYIKPNSELTCQVR